MSIKSSQSSRVKAEPKSVKPPDDPGRLVYVLQVEAQGEPQGIGQGTVLSVGGNKV